MSCCPSISGPWAGRRILDSEDVPYISSHLSDAHDVGEPHVLAAGTWFHMPAGMPHSIRATTPLTMALYLLAAPDQ